jgi:hypothetical protein
VDTAGNIYIADYGNNRIRKVTASTGIITTVAGNGTSGYSGDGGLATSAELNGPNGVAVDAASNIYIADAGNSRIREVELAGANISSPAVSVNCSPNPITIAGANSVCTVSVGGGATGTVSLTYNGTYWATLSLKSGSATAIWPSATGAGSYTISAAYSGDEYHAAATGSTVLVVGKAAPALSLSSSANPVLTGGTSIFTATIAGGVSPTGTITFQKAAGCPATASATTFGTATVSGSAGSYSVSNVTWATGIYTISAVYGGDGNNAGATATMCETVNHSGSAGTISLSAYSGYPGTSLTLTGTGFGASQGSSTVTFGTTQATVRGWSETAIAVTVPSTLAASSYTVAVNVSGAVVGQATFLIQPKIDSISMPSGPPLMGLVITGLGFGTAQGNNTVTIGNVSAKVVSGTWGVELAPPSVESTITVQIPCAAAIGSADIVVNIDDSSSQPVSSIAQPFEVVYPLGCGSTQTLPAQCSAQ